MNVLDQVITDRYALYNGDCIEVLKEIPKSSVHLSIYSPPFTGLYSYSSSERDLSNCRSYEEFFEHYEYVVREIQRITLPGRATAVHAMDVPKNGANLGGDTIDFPGDIIRLHQKMGWYWSRRYFIWKEPLKVRNRTMAKSLAHSQVVEDASLCDNAIADQLLIFRKKGDNPIPVANPTGLSEYIGDREVPHELLKYKGWRGKQTENRLSHWIWRQYASSFWDDIRVDNILPYQEARDKDDQAHCHPLQLDVIERCVIMRSNPGETICSPFLGVGSEVAGAVKHGRRGIGVELKPTFWRQAVRNLESIVENMGSETAQGLLFGDPPALTEQDLDSDMG